MSRSPLVLVGAALLATAVLSVIAACHAASDDEWTEQELALVSSLWLGSDPAIEPDPSNAVSGDPRAAELGSRLFFDTRLSATGNISCATCHQPERRFTDGLPRAVAIGQARRNTPSIVGAARSPWQYWDGRRDSLWAQALTPLEDPDEHGGNRMALVRLLAGDASYRADYESLFGPLPDFSDRARFPDAAGPVADPELAAAWGRMAPVDRQAVNRAFANLGKAIAAFEADLVFAPARFDAYVADLLAGTSTSEPFSTDEVAGLKLFIGEARCIECHNGPQFTNHEFHNTGVLSSPGMEPDRGRVDGLREVRSDPFNCLGPYSDAAPEDCAELRFVRSGPELIGAVRTPSLRNLGGTAPFAHQGQLETLADVLRHYNEAPDAMIGHNEAEPLGLSERELRQLEAFLLTLDAPIAAPSPTTDSTASP